MTPPRHLRILAIGLAVLAAAGSTTDVPAQASPSTVSIGRVDADGLVGHIGIDIAGGTLGEYALVRYWDADGVVEPIEVEGTPEWMRFEFYPESHEYDPWVLDVGGAHIERRSSMGSSWSTIGDVTLPALGRSFGGAIGFRIDGRVVSTTLPVDDGRVHVDSFQLGTDLPDPLVPDVPENSAGVGIGAFGSAPGRGGWWTAGVGWPGRYVLFIRDTLTEQHVSAIADIAPGRVPTIDLDAVCFGFATCQYDLGDAPAAATGRFHSLPPARILDTRAGLGITNGPVRTGGGWSSSDVHGVRDDERRNHELRVTGRHGVPSTGVSAVVLNLVAVESPDAAYLAVRPRRPSCCGPLAIHDDRSALDPDPPATSNLNVAAGATRANLVVARVGAGGTINLYNSAGPTHVIGDVVGWLGHDVTDADAHGYRRVRPNRILDTRHSAGPAVGRLAAGQTRRIPIAGVAGVGDDAVAVIVNLTATGSTGAGYVSAVPSGAPAATSSLNFTEEADRANTAIVPLGDDGSIDLVVGDAATHLVVDLLGSFGPGARPVTTHDPERVADSRLGFGFAGGRLQPGVVATLDPGLPEGTTTAVLNVTVTGARGPGHLTVFRGGDVPATSTVNFDGPDDVSNLTFAEVSADGTIAFVLSGAAAHVVVDVFGRVE